MNAITFNYRAQNVTSGGGVYGFKPVIANETVRLYIYENYAETGLTISVQMSWQAGESSVTQEYTYGPGTASQVFADAARGALTVTGLDNISAIDVIAVVSSDSDAEVSTPAALSLKL